MPQVSTLVLVTRPLGLPPGARDRLALGAAAEIALVQDGVYNDPEKLRELGLGVSAKWHILDEDAKARRIAEGVSRVHWAGLVEAIERNGKVIVL